MARHVIQKLCIKQVCNKLAGLAAVTLLVGAALIGSTLFAPDAAHSAPPAVSQAVSQAVAEPAPPALAAPSALAAAQQPAPDPHYLPELIQRAQELGLAGQRRWHLLLHYQPDLLGRGFTSEAVGEGFFLSPSGRTDPQAELRETLAAFFTDRELAPGQMTAQCTFPARWRWLGEQLRFDPRRLPAQRCERFQAWREALAPQSVTLIFASYFLNNPASMFGHTLLRLDHAGRTEGERLLDYSITYAAAVPPQDGALIYAWRGILGGYQGAYAVLPYYLKVREYSDIDSRDLWEYRLDLSADQMDWLLRHTWELGSTWFPYYFFKQNCAYVLLQLLDAGDPQAHLADHFWIWALPSDTVRVVVERPVGVAGMRYRPSRTSQLRTKLALLDGAGRGWVVRLVDDPAPAEGADFAALPAERRALILDAAVDDYQLRLAGAGPDAAPPLRERMRRLLLVRSRIPAAAHDPTQPEPEPPPQSTPPDSGHHTATLTLAAGSDGQGTGFVELGGQVGYHDLLSSDQGFAKYSQIDALHLQARYLPATGTLLLERLTAVDIVSLAPVSTLLRQPSWRVQAGWQRNRDGACPGCVPATLNGGAGYTVDGGGVVSWAAFAFAQADVEADPGFTDGYRAAPGLALGVLADAGPRWRTLLLAEHWKFLAGQTGSTTRVTFGNRLSLGRDVEARLNWLALTSDRVSWYGEAALEIQVHF